MNSQLGENRLAARLSLLWILGGVCTGVVIALHHDGQVGTSLLGLLGALALIAEFLPVEFVRRGVRITFSLPFIAAIAVLCNPAAGVAIDVLATSLVSVLIMRSRPRSLESRWIITNAAISGASASLAVLGVAWLKTTAPVVDLPVIVFIAIYAVVNLLLVVFVEWALTGRAWSDNTLSMVRTCLTGFALYSFVGLLVSVMLHEKLWIAIPFTLVPVWALRAGLGHRARVDDVYYETIAALTQMLQRAHPYTHGHLERVSRTAEEVAQKLGLSARRARLVREAAVLHDIGKIAVNEDILDKPGKLTPEELAHVRLHAVWGAEILKPVRGFSEIVPWIHHHHERPDGQGYPASLTDSKIPIESKIIAVVDAFDAMTGDGDTKGRPYRTAMSEAEALIELDRCAGTQFDRAVVEAFRSTIGGSLR